LVIPLPLPDEKVLNVILSKETLKNKSNEVITINDELLQAIQSSALFYLKVFPEYPLVDLSIGFLSSS
jgi:hypothetical protein